MSESGEKPLFDPDPQFASGWPVNEPLAQGALKHASVVILDELEEAKSELRDADPDLDFDEVPSLWLFPDSVRPALTFQRVDQLQLAATIVGWKLAQPGSPIPPGCIAEELALELIRQQADFALELEDAPPASLDATKGVYELCPHGNLSAYFEAQSPATAALSSTYALPAGGDEAGLATSDWFRPFYPGQIGCAPHPVYLERPRPMQPPEPRVSVVTPEPDSVTEQENDEKEGEEQTFRVFVRTWSDDFAEREEFEQMPDHWLGYAQAPTPQTAWAALADDEDLDLDRDDLARVSIDIQQAGLPQSFKEHGTPFHIVGSFDAGELDQHLPQLAAHLASVFPVALLAQDEEGALFGITAYAESHDEAEADFQDALDDFIGRVGLEWDLLGGTSCGIGKLEAKELLAEMKSDRRRRREWRRRSSSAD
jgi:hypothetical protein